MKFLVTGCGRSGTGYVSKLLGNLGIRTGHEDVCLPEGIRNHALREFDGDVSCWGIPYLGQLIWSDEVSVVHLVRHPFHVGRSYSHRRLFHTIPDPRDHYARAFYDEDRIPWALDDPADRFAAWWIRWNLAVELATAWSDVPHRFRVEDLREARFVTALADAVGFPTDEAAAAKAIAATDPTYNTKPRDNSFTLRGLSPSVRDLLNDTATRYGYNLDERSF